MSTASRLIASLAPLLAALALSGCSPLYESVDVAILSGFGKVDGDRIEIEEGRTMIVRVTPIAAGYPSYDDLDVVELDSSSPSIVFAEGARDVDEFVIGGVAPGNGSISVRVNGHDEDELSVLVIPQQPHSTEEEP